MSKLVYPNDGIYKYCRDDIEVLAERLHKIILNCDFDVPSEFNYKSYLDNLRSILNEFYNEIKNINLKLQSSDENFEAIETDMLNDMKKLIAVKIKERDRMIV